MISLSLSRTIPRSATAVDLPVAEGELESLGTEYLRAASLSGFKGKVGQTLVLGAAGNGPVDVLVGLGDRSEVSANSLRRSAAAYVRSVSHHKSVASNLVSEARDLGLDEAIRAVAEGLSLPTYTYSDHKSSPSKPSLRRVTIVASGRGTKTALTQAKSLVASVALARDLVNAPGGEMTPDRLARVAKEQGVAAGLKVTVWDLKRIRREKLGGLLGVNQGSVHEPRLVTMTYTPAKKARANVALVGKGVTFDSGGLSLKTGKGMMTMKIDMAGAAAVIAAMITLPVLGCPNRVTAYLPMTDNMPSGDALRPGDVVRIRNGKTVEVLNTDAEGRLILADALSLAVEAKPDVIADIATLTGSVTAALGAAYMGVMGDEAVVDAVGRAAATTGEQAWPLPLPAEYRKHLDSDMADLRNISKSPYGGALTAGLFLSEFVGDVPWAHLDLGISALSEVEDGIIGKGATGAGVRLLSRFASDWGTS